MLERVAERHSASAARRASGPAAVAAAPRAAGLLALQRAAGNRAVSGLLSRCAACADEERDEYKDVAGTAAAPAGGGASATAAATPKKTVTIYPISLGSSTRDP